MLEFNLLCDELQLTEALEDLEQLNRLKAWCYKQVSHDVTYHDHAAKVQYDNYMDMAKKHTINVLSKPPEEAIQYAAIHGYDRYLSKLDLPATAFNNTDKNNMSPLHWAACYGHRHTVDVLLQKGASPRAINNHAHLPICSALFIPTKHTEQLLTNKAAIFKTLLKRHPGSLNHLDEDDNSVLHLLVTHDHFNDLIKKILKKHPDVFLIPNAKKEYPIHTSILNNQIQNTQILLKSNLSFATQANRYNRTALHIAAQCGSSEMLHLCIEHSPDINIKDSYGKTPLILAAEYENNDAVALLLQKMPIPI